MSSISMGRYSEMGITTVKAFQDKIISMAGTTITALDSDLNFSNKGYNNAVLIFTTAQTTSTAYIDKIVNISTMDAATKRIVVDSTVGAWGMWTTYDGIAILPRPESYVCLNNDSIKETVKWDDTECLQAWEPSYHAALTVDTGGDLGIFVGSESKVLSLVLSAAFGYTTFSAGTFGTNKQTMYPGSQTQGLTIYVMRGNHVSLECYGGTYIDNFTIDQPAGAGATARITMTGGFGIMEMGGPNKTFPTGASAFWNPTSPTPDVKRMSFRHLVVSTGTYPAMTVPKNYAESASLTIARNPTAERRLGDSGIFDSQSAKFLVTGNVVQWFESDDDLVNWRGGHAKAFASEPSTFDIQYKWTGTATTGTFLEFDAFDVVWRDSTQPITNARIKETLTWQAKKSSSQGRSVQCIYDGYTGTSYTAMP